MVRQKVVIKNKSGLHLRPATIFSKIAAGCASDIKLIKGDKTVNPKSILFLMSAGVKCGDEIELVCSGETAHDDMQTLIDAINSGLGEDDE
ncbi:MAG: HPr family phosphocarrier protein [Caldicoprobacterales bacterium]|jgi:phosphocarrier protein HPr|nr:HPr family phosphocarrier protein [Clostridiales bacterium]